MFAKNGEINNDLLDTAKKTKGAIIDDNNTINIIFNSLYPSYFFILK